MFKFRCIFAVLVRLVVIASLQGSMLWGFSPLDGAPTERLWARAVMASFLEDAQLGGDLNGMPTAAELLFVEIGAHGIRYRYQGDDLIVRVAVVLDHLQQLSLRSDVPFGVYQFSLADGWSDESYLDDLTTPILAFSAKRQLVTAGKVMLYPDFEALMGYDELFDDLAEGASKSPYDKKVDKVFWRGATTGLPSREHTSLFELPRVQAISHYQHHPRFDVGFTSYVQQPADSK